MALFGKGDAKLPQLMKKLQTQKSFAAGEVDELLQGVGEHPDFDIRGHLWMFSFPQHKVRLFAASQARNSGSTELADQLIRELVGQGADVRAEMARVVVEMAPQRVTAHLGNMVHAKRQEPREAALDLIAPQPNLQGLIGYLKALLKDDTPQIRHRTVHTLCGHTHDSTVFMILRGLINDEDPKVRFMVIETLSRNPNPDCIEPFFERLPEETAEIRPMILRALKKLAQVAPTKVEKRLLPILADENPELRDLAVKLLAGMPNQDRLLRNFLTYCKGLAVWLRERSMETIRAISSDIIEPLAKLMQDEEPDIRVGAMVMAGSSTDPRILPHVTKIFLLDVDWWIQSMAADLLGNFDDEKVTETLLSRLDDPELRYSVVSVLGRHGNAKAKRALLACLEDSQRGIRVAALESLKSWKDADVAAALARIASHDGDSMVREKALAILEDRGEAQPESKVAATAGPADEIALKMVNEALNEQT